GGVDGALLQRRIDVAAGQLLRHGAQSGQDRSGKAADPELQALEIGGRLDFAAIPAAHLGPGVAGRNAEAIEVLQYFVEELVAARMVQPGIHLAAVEAERQRRAE